MLSHSRDHEKDSKTAKIAIVITRCRKNVRRVRQLMHGVFNVEFKSNCARESVDSWHGLALHSVSEFDSRPIQNLDDCLQMEMVRPIPPTVTFSRDDPKLEVEGFHCNVSKETYELFQL